MERGGGWNVAKIAFAAVGIALLLFVLLSAVGAMLLSSELEGMFGGERTSVAVPRTGSAKAGVVIGLMLVGALAAIGWAVKKGKLD